jgi:hypothetical protein
MSLQLYQNLLMPSSENFRAINSGEYLHDESTEESYRTKMVDEDTLLIEFESTSGHDSSTNKKKGLSRDWVQNLDFFPKKCYMYDTPYRIHRGFFQNWISVRQRILDELYNRKEVKFVAIRGFSQGGSVTVLAYQDVLYHVERDLAEREIRIGATAYEPAKVFYGANAPCLPVLNIVINYWDPVCMIPPFAKHVGKIVKIGKKNRILPIQHYPEQVERALDEMSDTGDFLY